MAEILPINQSKYEIELKKFIDHLAEIKIDFKLNPLEKEMVENAGSATILYTVCLQKCLVEKIDNKSSSKTLAGIRQSFLKYMLTLLKEDFIIFENLLKKYLKSLEPFLTKESPTELNELPLKFIMKGYDHLQEIYNIEDFPFNSETFFDGITSDEFEFNEEEDVDCLIEDFEKSQKKVKNILKKYNKSKTAWINTTAMAFNHKDKNFLVTMNTPQKLVEEYELVSDMVECLTTKYLEKIEICNKILDFIESRDLEDELDEWVLSGTDNDEYDDEEETEIIPF